MVDGGWSMVDGDGRGGGVLPAMNHQPSTINHRPSPINPPGAPGKKEALMVRIVVADPDAKERNRLRQHLSDGQHHEVVGLARDGQEAVQLTLQMRPDLVLLASRMPVLDGYQAAEMINLAVPGTIMAVMAEAE